MKSRLSIIAIVFTCMFLALSCKNNSTSSEPDPPDPPGNPNMVSENIGSDGGSVTSSDGLLTLSIPAGALGSTETITVEVITTDDLGSEFDDIEVENSYELGPDGLEFEVPITATFMTEQNPVAGPDSVEFVTEFLLASDDGQVTELDSLQTQVDFEAGTVSVTGGLTHFSPLVRSLFQWETGATGKFIFSGLPEEVAASPNIITAILTAQLIQDSNSEEPFEITYVTLEQDTDSPLEAVSPGEGLTGLPVSDFFQTELDYNCPEVGFGSLFLELEFGDENDTPSNTLSGSVLYSVDCKEPTPKTFTLTVQKDGDGTGTVTSNPPGIDFGSDNMENYNEGTMVTLTATPDQGSVFVTWSGDFDSSSNAADSTTIQLTMDQVRTVTATFDVEQTAGSFLQLGLFPALVVSQLETVLVLSPLIHILNAINDNNEFNALPQNSNGSSKRLHNNEGQLPVLLQGAEGFIVFDLITNEVLVDFTGLPNNGSVGERTPLGAFAVSRPNPGPNTPVEIISYALDRNNTEFGFNRFPYDPGMQDFIRSPLSPFRSTIDAFPIGGNIISDEAIIVTETGGIRFMRFSTPTNQYVLRPTNEALNSNRYGFEQPVTAYGEVAEGAILVVNQSGDLYFETRIGLVPTVLIGNLGQRIIRLRCKIPICTATDFDGNAIRIILWDGENEPSIFGNPVPVGDSPVDPDLYLLPNGNTLIGSTGFDDNTISLVEVDGSGNVISTTLLQAPSGLINPGHLIFLENPDDESNPFYLTTGFESDNYFVNDLLNTEGLSSVPGS